MKTLVLNIKPIEGTDDLTVLMSVGEQPRAFTFFRQIQPIGNTQISIITGDENFEKFFQFNQQIAVEVTDLASRVYEGEKLQYPIEVGDFGTKEEALALQKPFPKREVLLES